MQHIFIRVTLVTAAFALWACTTTTTTEGQAPIDYDSLNNLDGISPGDTSPGDTAQGDTTVGDDSNGGDGASSGDGTGLPPDTANTDGASGDGCGGGEVVCEANELCNPITGECEPIPQCGDINEACDPNSPEPLPYVCIEYEADKGICREHCVGPTFEEYEAGTYVNPCSEGYDCAALPGTDLYCVPSGCESFFVNTCGPDATCLPTWANDLNSCVPDGWGAYGDLCDVHTDCDHDLLCVDGVCADADCAPFTDTPACDDEQQCISAKVGAEELDMGWCADACEVFYPDCEVGTWCTPEIDKPEPGPINGYCIPDLGSAAEGTECEDAPNICDQGLLCVKSSAAPAVCERVCDPDAKPPITQGDCASDQACVPLLVATDQGQLDEVLDFGSCAEGCTPWGPQALSGCDSNWCLPTMFNPTDGQCLGDLGQVQAGDPCDDTSLETTCGAGMLCLDATAGAVLSGTCRVLCRAGTPPGGTGATCVGNESCDELELIGNNSKPFPTGIGWCNPH